MLANIFFFFFGSHLWMVIWYKASLIWTFSESFKWNCAELEALRSKFIVILMNRLFIVIKQIPVSSTPIILFFFIPIAKYKEKYFLATTDLFSLMVEVSCYEQFRPTDHTHLRMFGRRCRPLYCHVNLLRTTGAARYWRRYSGAS